jgi:molybdate/tungstate transport system ATP-binding protein
VIAAVSLFARTGSFRLTDVTFEVPEAGYGVVIGPAGAGKTTLLEAIGGIVPITSGSLRLDGRDATRLPPDARGVGLVYQHGYLFPHLSVEANVAYGAADVAFAREMIRRVGADDLWSRDVRSLSGGERQLVALARALARRPSVLLLDEPFSALDPRRRSTVRREVRALHREAGFTVLQVTHDFAEVGLLGDVAILLDGGCVLQAGPPDEVFRKPASPYIAEFLGAENVFAGVLSHADPATLDPDERHAPSVSYQTFEFRTTPGASQGSSQGGLSMVAIGDAEPGPAHAVIRAEEVVLSSTATASSARNSYRGQIVELATTGALTRVTVDIGGTPLVAALTTRSVRELALAPGASVYASFKAMAVHLC